jgi:hypothetical protein
MKLHPFCDPYVWENVKVLLYTGFFVKKHADGKCVSEYVNSIIFVFLLAFIIGLITSLFMGRTEPMPVMILVATLFSMPTFFELMQMKWDTEGFTDSGKGTGTGTATDVAKTNPADVYDVIGGAAPATVPSGKNPFMNILIDEIKYNPTRPVAASVLDPSVKVTLDDFFRTEFYSDPTDVFGRSQSQREFITMPSTSIPNDQGSYQDWLYKIPGKTCKEGGREACLPGTDGGALPWMNVNPV